MSTTPLPPKLAQITFPKHTPRASYVYFWREKCKIFYIGVGTGRRAWNTHLPYVEEVRQSCSHFNIVIFRDNLKKETAHELERELMAKHFHTVHNAKRP